MVNDSIHKDYSKEFLDSLLKGNKESCSSIVKQLVEKNIPIPQLYENLIKKSLYDIGDLWESNTISVATEHLASAIIEKILNETYPEILLEQKINKKVIVSCVETELHQIGLKMIADIFELHGWDTYFLGTSTTTGDLIAFAENIHPDVIALSLTLDFNFPLLQRMIEEFHSNFPNIAIIVGGQAFAKNNALVAQLKHCIYLPDIQKTEEFISRF